MILIWHPKEQITVVKILRTGRRDRRDLKVVSELPTWRAQSSGGYPSVGYSLRAIPLTLRTQAWLVSRTLDSGTPSHSPKSTSESIWEEPSPRCGIYPNIRKRVTFGLQRTRRSRASGTFWLPASSAPPGRGGPEGRVGRKAEVQRIPVGVSVVHYLNSWVFAGEFFTAWL